MSPGQDHLIDENEAGAAIALASLPGIGPAGLSRLLAEAGTPVEAWRGVREGRFLRPDGPGQSGRLPWVVSAGRVDPAIRADAAAAAGIRVTWLGRDDYPSRLADDPAPPPVLFWRGSLDGLGRSSVAVVGTRRCTAAGRAFARDLGRDLAQAGVCVVSGLALGIDGAAHQGALSTGLAAGTIGVAASGVDVVYPLHHRRLWEEVAVLGAVLSETPPGLPAQKWRFPIRNRVIAGLADLVVIVESHDRGGSLLTAEAALERGVTVGAVPGPVGSVASEGTNALLADGAVVIRDVVDALDALGDFRSTGAGRSPGARRRPLTARISLRSTPLTPCLPLTASTTPIPPTTPDPPARSVPADDAIAPAPDSASRFPGNEREIVANAVGFSPTSFNTVVAASGLGVAAVAGALEELAATGRIVEERGWWQRRR